jgi:hypothetical protein
LPDTVAVPTEFQPAPVQVAGAVVEGPSSEKVIVPVELEPEELPNTELIEPAAMAVPAVPLAGAAAVTVGEARATTVSVAEGQVLFAALLLVSPP